MDQPARLPSIGTLFTSAWDAYVQRFLFYTLLSFLPWLIAIIPFMVAWISFGIAAGDPEYIAWNPGQISIAITTAIFAMIIVFWGQSSLTYAVTRPAEKPKLKESLSKGWAYAGAYVWISILSVVVVFGSFWLLIVPAIVLGIWMSFGIFILMSEDNRGVAAIVKSKEYVRGYWWPVFGRLLLFTLLYTVISVIPIVSLLQIFLTPFCIVYGFTLYKQLKAIKGEVALDAQETEKDRKLLKGFAILGCIVIAALIGAMIFSMLYGY